jgi:adenylate kinase
MLPRRNRGIFNLIKNKYAMKLSETNPARAILLIGHSNAGKSPLGDAIENELSIDGKRFIHFDFGRILRAICSGKIDTGLSAREMAYIQSVMNGTLIDDTHFPCVKKIILWFLRKKRFDPDGDTLVMNGLPRHLGQAKGLDEIPVKIVSIIYLHCSPQTAYLRKCASELGNGFENRKNRKDSEHFVFIRKLQSFESDTKPLLAFYQNRGVPIRTIDVKFATSPEVMLRKARAFIQRMGR